MRFCLLGTSAFTQTMMATAMTTGILISLVPLRAQAADASYALKTEVTPAKKGEKSVVRIRIAPGAGYHMNKDYPTQVNLSQVPAGVTVDKPKQTGKDAVKLEEAGAEFDVTFTSAEVGQKVISGELKFAVCSASSCDPKKEKLSFTIDVK